MKNIMILIEYDGTNYHGWQRQPNGNTIQEVIENSILKISSEKIGIIASGRTDAGVHAYGQVANLKTSASIDDLSFLKALNSMLPKDIVIKELSTVSDDFHARYSAKSKIYKYIILNRPYPSSFYYRYSWYIPYPLDITLMRKGAAILKGMHDFSSFRAASCEAKDSVRTLSRLDIYNEEDRIVFYLEGNGFLKHMVRNIIGTIVRVGKGKISPDEIMDILASRDRRNAGPTAPPQGLFLVSVSY